MEQIIKQFESRVQGVLGALREELSSIRGNRPSPALVEDVKIEYFGSQVPIKQIGAISVVPPREIVISLWDPSNIEQVAKAILDAKRGFNPSVRGQSIYVTLPQLNQERREELLKLAKQVVEKYRIELRNFRNDANKQLDNAETSKEISEDMQAKGRKRIQDAVDRGNKDIEEILKKKEQEISE
ncbi:MAG: ribosome recycling factor [Candidatus Harrisonbacteria bacterium CG10_big_fil_rev_8_21_14_0_10_45_28]|uniref:Ribosome recycling factor n=1 Tax=Candidatus Harrisonbacteria bacterium CG10_big_fil_rev_8_21_14_0_10_45_28 TaxID=1974586 RepID=A0A2H0UMM8_9BACT|nr:MAG: ribosome recycling factor [Candidatus Harrisonbacteria bacterium CG10_big_fil_rev_8_21_14_0_10_45_28]